MPLIVFGAWAQCDTPENPLSPNIGKQMACKPEVQTRLRTRSKINVMQYLRGKGYQVHHCIVITVAVLSEKGAHNIGN